MKSAHCCTSFTPFTYESETKTDTRSPVRAVVGPPCQETSDERTAAALTRPSRTSAAGWKCGAGRADRFVEAQTKSVATPSTPAISEVSLLRSIVVPSQPQRMQIA